MYSGINGCEMKADIFFGIVHYQRLRHMVSDKWQVRPSATIYDPCYIWQILCVIYCWITYDINISHLTDCPRAWQAETNSVFRQNMDCVLLNLGGEWHTTFTQM